MGAQGEQVVDLRSEWENMEGRKKGREKEEQGEGEQKDWGCLHVPGVRGGRKMAHAEEGSQPELDCECLKR